MIAVREWGSGMSEKPETYSKIGGGNNTVILIAQ